MSDRYFFPEGFRCMYCQVDLDTSGELSLGSGENIDLRCPKCDAIWKFWVKVQLNHKLTKKGKYNK